MDDQPTQLQEVFVLSGVPEHTFVQPVEYPRILVAFGLRTAGRSIVVEGPSGIGKTTAVMKAISEAGLDEKVILLSGRKADDIYPDREGVHRDQWGLNQSSLTPLIPLIAALPDSADPDAVKARGSNGVLIIEIGKREKALPRRIPVEQ